MEKKILHILTGRDKQITPEETIKQPLPHQNFRFANPFIVIHHLPPEEIKPGSQLRIHPHPHRGFSPVTFTLQGEGFHRDNAGHDNIVKAGDVQWMFAGKGLLHSEGPTPNLLKNGGVQEFIQIWVNAPAAHKWDAPFYQSAKKEEQPPVLVQPGVELRLASGSFDGKIGPLKSHTPVISVVGTVKADINLSIKANEGYWTLLYIANGSASVNGNDIDKYQLVVFDKANTDIDIRTTADTTLLFLSAQPIDEPIAAKDNFVMNTKEEIEQAMEDYKNGVFGALSH